MNLDLKSDKLNYMRGVKRRFTREETIEVIVPDALPDILRVLDTDGVPCLRGKDAGEGRVSVTGVTELAVLYVPESGSGIKKLGVSLPFNASAEGPDIDQDCLITACVRLISADARTVNPRKLVVRAEVACDVETFTPVSVYNCAPREQEGVWFLPETRRLRLPVAVNEKTFVATDEHRLPAGADIGEVLRYSTCLTLESAKPVGSKAVVKGSADTCVLYLDREGTLRRESFSSPFSQIVDTDATGEAESFDVALAVTGAYVTRTVPEDGDGDALSLELHAVAQCAAIQELEAAAVADVYSTAFTVEPQLASIEFPVRTDAGAASETVTMTAPTAGRAANVLDVTARVGAGDLREREDGQVFTAAVTVNCIYTDAAGEVLSASKRQEFEYKLPEAGLDCALAMAGTPFAAPGDTGIEVRVPLELRMVREEPQVMDRVESLEIIEDQPLDLTRYPNMTVVRARPGVTLWELAKRYMSTEEMIREVNGLEGAPADGAVLLVPRCG